MGSKTVAAVLAAAAVAAFGGAASAQVQPTGAWAAEAAGTQYRYGGSASDGTYLYTFGGPSNVNSYRSTRRYDPATNVWTELALMPTQTQWNAGAYHNGRLFSFGNNWNGTGTIYQYTISTNTWTTLPAVLSNNRSQASAATLGDLIYIGGGASGAVSNQLDEFNPDTGAITVRATMPGSVYRNTMSAVPALNKVYSFCGLNQNGQQQAVCYEYTPETNTWQTRAPMTDNNVAQIRQGPFSFSLNNRIYVTGGHNGQQYSPMTMEYNPMIDAWNRRADLLTARAFHGGAVVAGKGLVYGGEVTYTTCEEYTPPVFGSDPVLAGEPSQAGSQPESALQAVASPDERDGWTNNQITFSAPITDPDAGQLVRLRVRVKPATAPNWNNATVLDSGFGAQGVRSVTYNIPATGGFDWQYRIEDAFANSFPAGGAAWADSFGNTSSPDFRSDQEVPTDPVALSPHATDVAVTNSAAGPVNLTWTESTDNGPASGISYEVQVAHDGGFNGIEAQIFSTAGTDSTLVTLSVARTNKFWRLRARDVGGNFSGWSAPLDFRVVWDDGENHGSGDARKGCGLSAPWSSAALIWVLAGLALLGGLKIGDWRLRMRN